MLTRELVNGTLKQGLGPLLGLLLGAGMIAVVGAHNGPATSGVIHACVNSSTGQLHIVAADGLCKAGETPLDWQAQGQTAPIPVGGGLTGRWESVGALACGPVAQVTLSLGLVMDGMGNLTGAVGHQQHRLAPTETAVETAAVLGKATGLQVHLQWGPSTSKGPLYEFQGTAQDANRLTGTYSRQDTCAAPVTLQRTPLVP